MTIEDAYLLGKAVGYLEAVGHLLYAMSFGLALLIGWGVVSWGRAKWRAPKRRGRR